MLSSVLASFRIHTHIQIPRGPASLYIVLLSTDAQLFGLMNKWTQTNPNWYSDMQLPLSQNRVGIWIISTSSIQTECSNLILFFLFVRLFVCLFRAHVWHSHKFHTKFWNRFTHKPLQMTIGNTEITSIVMEYSPQVAATHLKLS